MKNIILLLLMFICSMLLLKLSRKSPKAGALIYNMMRGFWPGMALHMLMYDFLNWQVDYINPALLFVLVSLGIFFSIYVDSNNLMEYMPVIIISCQTPVLGHFNADGWFMCTLIILMLIIERYPSLLKSIQRRYSFILVCVFILVSLFVIKSYFYFLFTPVKVFSGGVLIYYCFSAIFSQRYKADVISASSSILGFLASLVFYTISI